MVYIGCFDTVFMTPNPSTFINKLKSDSGKGIGVIGEFSAIDGSPSVSTMNSIINANLALAYHLSYSWSHGGGNDGLQVMQAVPLGTYDVQITNMANLMKQIKGTRYLSMQQEFNGNWNPQCVDPASFIAACQHTYKLVKSIDPTILIGIYGASPPTLDVNSNYAGAYPVEDYYPGDNYLDWWGMDVYSGQIIPNTAETYYSSLGLLTLHPSKPFMIPELGPTWSWYPDQTTEANWLTDMFNFIANNASRIPYFMMYDFSGINANEGWNNYSTFYQAYIKAVANPLLQDASIVPSQYTLNIGTVTQ